MLYDTSHVDFLNVFDSDLNSLFLFRCYPACCCSLVSLMHFLFYQKKKKVLEIYRIKEKVFSIK